jgi:3'(2'), 5'-bisphosphate nucleotidase
MKEGAGQYQQSRSRQNSRCGQRASERWSKGSSAFTQAAQASNANCLLITHFVSLFQMLIPEDIVDIAERAGEAILRIYERCGTVASVSKEDGSPLTVADQRANEIIVAALEAAYPDIPILTEEAAPKAWLDTACLRYWAVDPLDGTKEFLKRNGEFTINIALVENGTPVLGVVTAPVLGVAYAARKGAGAWKRSKGGEWQAIHVAPAAVGQLMRVVASRSHATPELEQYLQRLPPHTLVSMGSSLKLCLVAEGAAQLYPRLGPTCYWDTAAAHAIVLEAGGIVVDIEGRDLRYDTPDHPLNPQFIAACDAAHGCRPASSLPG